MLKWGLRILGVFLVLNVLGAIGTYIVIDRSVVEMFGGRTPVISLAPSDDTPERYVLADVRVLEPGSERFSESVDVLIEDGLIARIGPDIAGSGGAPVMDGEGRYLIPGLTDSHVHLWNSQNDLALYLAHGVTQIREMHGQPHHLEWRDQITDGDLLGPDIFVVAAQIATYDFAKGLWQSWTSKRNVARTPEAADQMVRDLAADGYDAVKASSYLSLSGYQAVSVASEAVGIPLVGHIPMAARLDDLWASNQSEVAHVEELVKGLDRDFGGYGVSNAQEYLEYVRGRRDEVAQHMIDNEIVLASTLALVSGFAQQITDTEAALETAPVDYVNPGVAEGRAMGWLPDVNIYSLPQAYRTDGWRDRYLTYWNTYAEAQQLIFETALAAGVPMVAGTDANVPVMAPGFSLHQELEALTRAGMTPAEALESATGTPSDWMDWNTGRVLPGFRANLVLLRDNPLEDIRNTRSIDAVMIHGELLSRETLDAMLDAVEAANDSARHTPLDPAWTEAAAQ
jgi:hypothetical protein